MFSRLEHPTSNEWNPESSHSLCRVACFHTSGSLQPIFELPVEVDLHGVSIVQETCPEDLIVKFSLRALCRVTLKKLFCAGRFKVITRRQVSELFHVIMFKVD